jgi:hypothetical protein
MQSSCYSCEILMKFELYRQVFEKYQILNIMKIRPVGAELFHADGRADGETDREE